MSGNPSLRLSDPEPEPPDPPPANRTVGVLLVPAEVAGRMCGRSEASWWRDHAASRVPAPVRLGGRTLWSVEELRDWVRAGCPCRKVWEAVRRQEGGAR
jgi:hypothetical protein